MSEQNQKYKSKLFFISAFFIGFAVLPAHAETISAQLVAANSRLVPLQKITVGPDDQYAAAVDPQRKLLVYVHKSDLVAHLVAHDLKSGDELDLLPLTADSQEPMFAPDGRLVFTYFKHDARGDICYFRPSSPLKTARDEDMTCLPRTAERKGLQRSNPFWVNDNEIGYLERDVLKSTSQIVVESLNSKSVRVLVSGSVWSPSMRSGGHLLVFNELLGADEAHGWRTAIRDVKTGKTVSVHLALPGLSGFPILSEDERYLYFSHFMNDSNDDQMIDGSDNAVVFRLPVQEVFDAKMASQLMPEQLTSSDSSCSFPRPIGDQVYATCAFEGSLDIYSMPLTGVVPTAWSTMILQNAIETSRSYAERILLLNTMKTRLSKNIDLDQSLFFNHLMEDDTVAARYYLSQMTGRKGEAFHRLTRFWLQARELKKAQPVDGEVGREYRRAMMTIDQAASGIKGEENFLSILRGSIRADLGDWNEAQTFLARARSVSPTHPIERYFRFELAKKVAERSLPKSLPMLLEAYRTMMAAPELSEESQIYYGFNLLKTLVVNEKNLGMRVATIEKLIRDSKGPVATLLKSEVATLRIVSFSAVADQDKAFRDVNQIMNEVHADYFLRKAVYVRAILNLTAAANFKYLSVVASNWLRDTGKNDTEFAYAREVFSNASLDQAYAYLGKGDLPLADSFFYGSVQATDDLESHYGYITTAIREGKRSNVDKQYAYLSKRHYVEDNMKYVEALLTLIDNEGGERDRKDPSNTKSLIAAIQSLESMTGNRDSSSRHLLLGYAYMEKMRRTAIGAEFDSVAFENAHRHLMLANDLGRDNVRVRISALMNLGILHERALNHALAARYFFLRLKLPFENRDERSRFDYLYARALDRSRQPEAALKVLADVPVKDAPPAMIERQGYEAALAGHFETACEYYEKLLSHPENVTGDENIAKIQLMYGYSLLRAGRKASAVLNLQTSLTHLKKLKMIERDQDHIVALDPARLIMIANGLLAQAALDSNLEVSALKERAQILSANLKTIDGAGDALIQAHLQMAAAMQTVNLKNMLEELNQALALAEKSGGDGGFLSRAIFRTLVSYFSVATVQPDLFRAGDSGRASGSAFASGSGRAFGLYQSVLAAYDNQLAKVPQDQLTYQKAKLEILWASFATKVLQKPVMAPHDLKSILDADAVIQLKSRAPDLWSELDELGAALRNNG